MAFINSPMIWQKLEVVRMVGCAFPAHEEECVDFSGLGELLLRSRIKTLDLTHTVLGNEGWVARQTGALSMWRWAS